jgi:hypothetical protein
MNVLIATANSSIFTKHLPKLKINPATTNTSTFSISEAKFKELRDKLRAEGYNPYAIMAW